MTDLLELVKLCKGEVSVEFNPHRNEYRSITEQVELFSDGEVSAADLQRMVNTDTLVVVRAYPNTPVGHFMVMHWDAEVAIQQVLAAVQQSRAS